MPNKECKCACGDAFEQSKNRPRTKNSSCAQKKKNRDKSMKGKFLCQDCLQIYSGHGNKRLCDSCKSKRRSKPGRRRRIKYITQGLLELPPGK